MRTCSTPNRPRVSVRGLGPRELSVCEVNQQLVPELRVVLGALHTSAADSWGKVLSALLPERGPGAPRVKPPEQSRLEFYQLLSLYSWPLSRAEPVALVKDPPGGAGTVACVGPHLAITNKRYQ